MTGLFNVSRAVLSKPYIYLLEGGASLLSLLIIPFSSESDGSVPVEDPVLAKLFQVVCSARVAAIRFRILIVDWGWRSRRGATAQEAFGQQDVKA